MTLSINGIAVSRGIAMGQAYKIERGQPEVAEACIPANKLDEEISRFTNALAIANTQLKKIRDRIPSSTASDITTFIDTHLLMLNDPALSDVPIQTIKAQKCSAEWAMKQQLDALVAVFDEMDDPYLKTRRDDVMHVVNRILRILMDEEIGIQEDKNFLRDKIVIADDLTPADIVLLQHQGMSAFITESGGPLSHTAIMARSLKLPAIVGIRHAKRYLQSDDEIIIDGDKGIVLVDASDKITEYYLNQQQSYIQYYSSLDGLKDKPAVTLDQTPIQLLANAELPEDIQTLHETSVDGIGLLRTEYLFMNRNTIPDEQEQYQAYRKIAETMQGKPVTIRTLDLGADKPLRSIQYGECPTNPALGLRAIRLCLKDSDLFRPQLRAILRASHLGNVRIMIPMLSNIQEVFQVMKIIDGIKRELRHEGKEFDEDIQVGGMIEVPAAAITAHLFAKHLDFLSIGTNDLIQYTLAIDRIDEEVNYLYKPSHPSVLHLINHIIEAGNHANIPVTMCGEMAGDPAYTRLLLGFGLRKFSMQPNAILEVKSMINQADIHKIKQASLNILQCEHAEDALTKIRQLNAEIH